MVFPASVKDLTKQHYLGLGYGFIALIIPGILFIHHFKYNEFLTLDISKIFILSLSITTPVIFFNYVISMIFDSFFGPIYDDKIWSCFVTSNIVASSAFYLTLYYFYFVNNYCIRDFVIYLSITNFILLIIYLILDHFFTPTKLTKTPPQHPDKLDN